MTVRVIDAHTGKEINPEVCATMDSGYILPRFEEVIELPDRTWWMVSGVIYNPEDLIVNIEVVPAHKVNGRWYSI